MTNLPKEYIPTGSYVIESSSKKLLSVLLSSSVGVALVDKTAGIGGIMHILLPEPIEATTTRPPESYASSGLPLFIESLLEAGSEMARLEATISGGSLSGRGSNLYLDFDTGGLIVEIVLGLLRNENISIVKSETNGYFGSELTLNTASWETEIQPIIPQSYQTAEPFKKPSNVVIDEAISGIRPIPQIALKIIRIIRDGDYEMRDLANEIQQDQVISAKVLRFCNSPIIGLRQKIDSIDRAVALLGENNLLEVVVSASVDPFLVQVEGGYSMMRGGLYQHSLGVANISKILALYTGKTDPESAFTAGLVHDIGKVVLDQYISRSLPLFYQSIRTKDCDFVDLEQEFIGIDHQEVGKKLAERWNLPENLIEAIAIHHFPEQSTVDKDLAHLVYLADLLSSRFQAGLEFERITSKGLAKRLEHIGLSPAKFHEVIAMVPWEKLVFT